jgi:hypothetical protein
MGRVPDTRTISGAELRRRIDRLGLNYIEAAPRLGLTVDGLQKQMRAVHRVSRQTELLLKCLEKHQPRPRCARQCEDNADKTSLATSRGKLVSD